MLDMEHYVNRLKAQAGVTGSDEGALLRMLDALPGVGVRWTQAGPPRCKHHEDGAATVILPLSSILPISAAAHETGHAAFSTGMGQLLLQMAEGNPKLLRLARRWEQRDEHIAEAFTAAFLEAE